MSCSICLENIKNDRKELSCGHLFHKGCIDLWLNKNTNCPYCRKQVSKEFNAKKNYLKYLYLKFNITINDDKIIISKKKLFSNNIKIISLNKIKSVTETPKYGIIIFRYKNKLKKYKFIFRNNNQHSFVNNMKILFDNNIS